MRSLARLSTIGLGLVLVACGSLLGLEDRQLDESELSASGYSGCRPGEECDGCITERHREACEAGVDSTGSGGSDGDSRDTVDVDGSGAAGGTGGTGGSGSGGSDSKRNVGGAQGGTGGSGGTGAVGGSGAQGGTGGSDESAGFLFDCDADLSFDLCLSCVCDTCAAAIDVCQADDGCGAIGDCVFTEDCDPVAGSEDTCYQDGICQSVIDEYGGLTSESYDKMMAIVDCATGNDCPCYDAPCGDGDCGGCETCFDECLCQGGNDADCSVSCQPPPAYGCDIDIGCDQCGSCMGACLCEGNAEEECLSSCGLSACAGGDCNTCATNVESCLCEGGNSDDCFAAETGDSCVDYFSFRVPGQYLDCYLCVCDECPAVTSLCETDPSGYCAEIVQCMESTGCTGVNCETGSTCGDVIGMAGGGMDNYSVQLAEGVIACRADHDCQSCPFPEPQTISCGGGGAGGITCFSYVPEPPEPIANACCAGMDGELCGLDLGAYFATAPPCAPTSAPGYVDDECQDFQVNTANYNEFLEGCCRPDATCGLMETRIGMGCVPPGLVGAPMNFNNQPCTF